MEMTSELIKLIAGALPVVPENLNEQLSESWAYSEKEAQVDMLRRRGEYIDCEGEVVRYAVILRAYVHYDLKKFCIDRPNRYVLAVIEYSLIKETYVGYEEERETFSSFEEGLRVFNNKFIQKVENPLT